MSGYDWSAGKSNNAVDAESCGLLTASRAAKRLGVSTKAIKHCLMPQEWHHCSGRFNKVYYYDVESLEQRQVEELKAYDSKLKQQKKEEKTKIIRNVDVSFSEFVWRKEKWKYVGEKKLSANRVALKAGNVMAEIVLSDGRVVRKKAANLSFEKNGKTISL